jgi:probable F420-dependent oxidoreductase
MKIGAIFPNPEIGTDPEAVRSYAQGLEEIGLSYMATYDHIVGADLTNRPDWKGPYSSESPFHEPLTMLSFMAAITTTLEFSTSIMILPQRQTALLAKQAAELALLSNNRFRLGGGIGWNSVEYEAQGIPWERRGDRLEEQVELLRLLWTEHSIDYQGEFHHIPEAGINPLPSRPIPIWLGGGVGSPRALARIARLADGWMAPSFSAAEMADSLADWRRLLDEAGRSDQNVGLEVILPVRLHGEDRGSFKAAVEGWREAGATNIGIATHGAGCRSVSEHLQLLNELKELANF